MKKLVLLIVLLISGLAVGGGAAFATATLLGPRTGGTAAPHAATPEKPPVFVPTGKILAPLAGADGKLTGYVSFDVQLDVAEDKAPFVTARLPLLLHAINMRTYRTPLASGPDGMLPNLEGFRAIVEQAATEAFGPGIVRRAAITGATPA